jgi:membrane-associated phospholipid phosphatase
VTAEPAARIEGRSAAEHASVTRFRPVDLYTLAYLAFGFVLLVLFSGRVHHGVILALVHLAGMAALVAARKGGLGRSAAGSLVLDFYPLVLFGVFYTEVGVLVHLLHPGVFFDADIQRVEEFLFHTQPSRTLRTFLPWRPLGEYLHLGYFSYYFLVPVLAFMLRFRRSRAAFETAIAVVAMAFYICFVVFITFPVAGPYYSFTPPAPGTVGYVVPRIVHWILDHGSSVGAAFPSSHVAVSVTVWIMAMRYHRPLARVYFFLVPALAVGAVYGGFHYGTDVLVGAVLAVVVGTVGHRFTAWMEGRLTGSRPHPAA